MQSNRTIGDRTASAYGKPAVEYEQEANEQDRVEWGRISTPGRLQFDFASIPVTGPPIQRKPTVSFPGDPLERQADDVADKVMRMVAPGPIGEAPVTLHRKCTQCEAEEKELQTSRAKQATARPVASQGVEELEEEFPSVEQAVIFRKAEFAAQRTTPASEISGLLAGRQTGGEALPAVTRQTMENAFGYDFSRVRVHRDTAAGETSRQINAHAFTYGSHIYFGHGKYDPDAASGKRLLAHELTHVVQQGEARRNWESAALTVQADTPAIQRTATWAAGSVHETNNLANSILNGPPVGVTWPKLNGSTFWSTADVRRLLAKPTLAFASSAGGGIDATVAIVPTNTGSFDETVLAAGPWSVNATKATVGTRFPALTTCTGAGNSTFSAKGKPDDAAMFAANRRHEDRHATDHETSFNGSVVPWDTKLTGAKNTGTVFNGPTEADAEAALYAAMGGKPDQIADSFLSACKAAVVAYHSTPAGGPVTVENPTANADCSASSVESSNPS